MGEISAAVAAGGITENREQRSDSGRRAATIVLVVDAKGPVPADSFIGELSGNCGER